ncbi:hypothetical protein WL27_22835 [Burkholderia multivorans]|nr:hypothetical protein WL27_22835 [Burkholderia multivorans]
MPLRNRDIKPRRFLACPNSMMARVSVATARSPSHHAVVFPVRSIALRLRSTVRQHARHYPRRSPEETNRCASADRNAERPERRSNAIAAHARPTLLVTGRLAASDEIVERVGLHVSERAESVARALRQSNLSVDALIAHVALLRVDLAVQFVSLAQARGVRAAAVVYEYGSAQALSIVSLAGFLLFRSVRGHIDQPFVLTKLQQSIATMYAATPAAPLEILRMGQKVKGYALAGSSRMIGAGSPAVSASRPAPTRGHKRHPSEASPNWRRRRSRGF